MTGSITGINPNSVLDMMKHFSRFAHLQNRYVLVFDDIGRFGPFIGEFLKLHGGTFRDLTLSELTLASTIPDESLESISDFSRTLNIAMGKATGNTFFSFDRIGGGQIEVKLMIEEDGSASQGKPLAKDSDDRASILATIITCPVSCSYEGSDPIGLLYNLESLDSNNIVKLNEYFCEHLKKLIPSAKLIIFIRTNKLNTTFFRMPSNLIGALMTDEFIPIAPAVHNIEGIKQWSKRLNKTTPSIFFLGAGCSSEADIPMADELRRKSLEQLLGVDATDEELENMFWDYVKSTNSWLPGGEVRGSQPLTFERVIREQIRKHDYWRAPTLLYLQERCSNAKPSMAHSQLGTLASKGYKILIITTNYDELIEQVILDAGKKPLVIADEKMAREHMQVLKTYMEGKIQEIPVIKLHGTISRLDTMAASVDDTRILKQPMRELLKSILSTEAHKGIFPDNRIPVLFAGYAFEDTDVGKVLERDEILGGMEEWVVNPLPRRKIYEFLYSDLTERSRIDQDQRVLSTTFDIFMETLIGVT